MFIPRLLRAALIVAAVAALGLADRQAALRERIGELKYPGGGVVEYAKGAARAAAGAAADARHMAVEAWRKIRRLPPAAPAPEAESAPREPDTLAGLLHAERRTAGRLGRAGILFASLALVLLATAWRRGGRRALLFDLVIVAALCLLVGLNAPCVFVDVETAWGGYSVKRFSGSILETVRRAFGAGEFLIGAVILLFSVVTPAGKLILALERLAAPDAESRAAAGRLLATVGKWSMVDVLVVALVVFSTKFGRASGFTVDRAEFGAGLYFFLGYCLLSGALVHLDPEAEPAPSDAKETAP